MAEPSEEGLRVVLSPVQLAAVLQGEHVGAHEILVNRLWGGAKIIGGALELIGSGALFLTPELTMLTKAGGVALGAHGTDTLVAGARQVWTGDQQKTLTQQAGEGIARELGATPEQAERTGVIVDVAVPILVATVAAAVRIASIRAGRIVLADEEALGGHMPPSANLLEAGFHPAVIDSNPSDLREVIDVLGRNRILQDFQEPKPTKINATGANFGIMSSFDGSIAVEMETKYRMTNFGTAFLRACHASKR